MADRVIEYKISAVDNASGPLARYAENLKRVARTTQAIDISPVFGRRDRDLGRTRQEQDVRNVMAERIKTMREQTRRATAEAVAEERLFGQRVAQEVKSSNQKIAKEMSFLDRLKRTLGPRGTVKDIAELFVGGGAIAAVGFITNQLAQGARNARELVDEFRQGKIEAGELSDKLAGTIPILGGIWRAGRDIREIMTGEQAELQRVREESDLIGKSMNTRLDLQKRINDSHREFLEIIEKISQRRELRFMPEPLQSLRGSQFDEAAERQSINDKAEKDLADLNLAPREIVGDLVKSRLRASADVNRIAGELQRAREAIDLVGPIRGGKGLRELEQQYAEALAREKQFQDQLNGIRKDQSAAEQITADRNKALEQLEKDGIENRRKILLDGGKQMVRDFLESALERIRKGREVMEEERQQREEAERDQFGADRFLSRIKIDRLEEEARLGNGLASIEAERLRIQEQYAAVQREIEERLKNQNLTAEQRLQLERELAGLSEREANALSRLGEARRDPTRDTRFGVRELASTSRGAISDAVIRDDKAIERQQFAEQKITNTKLDKNHVGLISIIRELITVVQQNAGSGGITGEI